MVIIDAGRWMRGMFLRLFGLVLLFTLPVLLEAGEVPLATLVNRYRLHRSEDMRTGTIVLTAEGLRLVIALDMDIALLNGRVCSLGGYVRRSESGVTVPAEVERLIVKSLPKRVEEAPEAEKKVKVVIDPGHGGKFSGAVQCGIREAELNLEVSLIVERLLKERGILVVMTRRGDNALNSDWSRDLDERVNISNRLNADLFVSIHANSSPSRRARGSDVFIARPSEDASERVEKAVKEAPALAEDYGELLSDDGVTRRIVHRLLFEEKYRRSLVLAECLATALRKNPYDAFNRINECGFRVVKWTRAPAALVEMGFISNPETAELFRKKEYKVRLARLIAEGISSYVERVERSSDFSDSRVEEKSGGDGKRMQPKDDEGASYREEGAFVGGGNDDGR